MAGFRRDGRILQSDPFALAYMKCSEVCIILTTVLISRLT